jgi:3',5'-cyclic AMP phosphodiesterase CpdA
MAILAFLTGIFLRIVGLILSVVLMFTGLRVSNCGTAFEVQNPADIRLHLSVFADVHMQTWTPRSYYQLARSLRDIRDARQRPDALVLLGDNTMNGQVTEYIMLYGIMRRFNRVRETFVVMGNHDLALDTTNARTAIDRHNFFWRAYDRTRAAQAYYSRVINGYTLVAIAGEGPDCERHISDAQLVWLADVMANSPEGKPIFVFVHQHIHEDIAREAYFPRAAEIRNILEQYDNVFVFNGHWHTIPLSLSVENGVNYVNVPGLHSHVGYEYAGEGLQIEVYDDTVVLRGRNFMHGEWTEIYFEVTLNS